MKKGRNHNIDKLFHEELGGQHIEPSPGIWKSLSTHIPAPGGRRIFLYLISGILIGAFVVFMHSDRLNLPEELALEESSITETQSGTAVITENKEIQSTNDKTTESKSLLSTTDSSPEYTPEQIKSKSAGTAPVILLSPEISGTSRQHEEGQGNRAYITIPSAGSINGQVEANSTMGIRESSKRDYPDPIFDLNIKDSYAKKADVFFGAAFSPAVNIYPDAQNRNDYSLEFITAYEKSRFMIETGIGGNYTSESAEYSISYTSFDSVGYYVGVSSFTVDPVNPDSVIFETKLKNLYDSIDHYSVVENTNKYAYLQIPLRIGYRVIQTPRFSIDLKAGLLFSVQIYKDIPGVPYQGNDAEVEVVRQYPDRLSTTWQYTAGLGLNYHINNKIRFTLEPFYRQYIKSAYSPASEFPARSPYAFGIRGGLYFHF